MENQEKFIPNYMKIQNYISQKIESGEYQEGTKIPSETEFAEMFSVSRITANKAIKEMSVLGILNRVQGDVCQRETGGFYPIQGLRLSGEADHYRR